MSKLNIIVMWIVIYAIVYSTYKLMLLLGPDRILDLLR